MNKHWKNLSYILRHKWHVFKMGLKYRVWWHQLLLHDLSKFTPLEWFGYTNHFYGKSAIKQEMVRTCTYAVPTKDTDAELSRLNAILAEYKEQFEQAWNHHQKANKHHWQYWVLRNDNGPVYALRMPERFIREMVADWAGASLAIRGFDDTLNWYSKNRDIMILHDETRDRVEQLLGFYRREDGVLDRAG